MAILNSCPGLEVKVVSNGKALNEFVDSQTNESHNTFTKYVQVDTDGAFEAHIQFNDAYTCRFGVCVEIRLDGHKVGGSLYRSGRLKKAEGHSFAGTRSKIGGRWHVSNFKFSKFVLELDQATTERLKSTGVITVLIHRVKNIRACATRRPTRSTGERPQGISEFGRVPEKIVKDLGLSHHGSVDWPKREKGVRTLCSTNVDGNDDEHAIAIFNFKYRSLAMLKALRIVPTTPEPIFLPSRSRTPATDSASTPRQAHPTPDSRANQDGLSIPELLVLIKAYRGSVTGLEGLGRKDLMILLEHHRASDKLNIQDNC